MPVDWSSMGRAQIFNDEAQMGQAPALDLRTDNA